MFQWLFPWSHPSFYFLLKTNTVESMLSTYCNCGKDGLTAFESNAQSQAQGWQHNHWEVLLSKQTAKFCCFYSFFRPSGNHCVCRAEVNVERPWDAVLPMAVTCSLGNTLTGWKWTLSLGAATHSPTYSNMGKSIWQSTMALDLQVLFLIWMIISYSVR